MNQELQIEILLKEYELINQKIERFVGNQFLYTQGTLALAGGYIFFLIEGTSYFDASQEAVVESYNNTKFYIQFLPYVLLTILMGVAYQLQRTLGLQGYKCHLEELINKKAGENLISYAHIGMRYMVKNNVIAWVNSGIYVLLYAASVALAYYKPPHPISKWYLVSHIVLAGALAVVVLLKLRGHQDRVKEAAGVINKSDKKITKTEF
ncbi:hypothetical protein [Altibacter lentus]|uniref:hypothetical protein n=1 Tax=Altibacter lentus TaxID=1223410 RepID=UPI000558912F|nr:hypothetical protein [Altibacter lentus]